MFELCNSHDVVAFYISMTQYRSPEEYESYHSKPEQIKRRAKRNEARRSLKDRKDIKGKDVHHKDNNPMNNDKSNLSIVSQKYNRSEPRMRKLKEKGCLPNGKKRK